MNYEKTIVTPVLKNKVTFSLSSIFDYDNFQKLEENAWDWNLTDNIYQQGTDLYNFSDMLEDVKKYLISKLKISKKELSQWDDDIKTDLIRACSRAYESSYLNELYTYFQRVAKDKIESIAGDLFTDIKCKILYYSSEDKTFHSEMKYNTDEICLYIPKNNKTIQFLKNNLNNFELQEIKADFETALNEYIAINIYYSDYKINLEHFDDYGTKGDYDDYLECFKDDNEVEHTIREAIKKKCKHTHNMIKNKVELIYR